MLKTVSVLYQRVQLWQYIVSKKFIVFLSFLCFISFLSFFFFFYLFIHILSFSSETSIQQFSKRRDSQHRIKCFVFLCGSWCAKAFDLLDSGRVSRIDVPWKWISKSLQNHRWWKFAYKGCPWKRRRTLRLQRDQSSWREHSYGFSSGIISTYWIYDVFFVIVNRYWSNLQFSIFDIRQVMIIDIKYYIWLKI